jgi:hypothetical protein
MAEITRFVALPFDVTDDASRRSTRSPVKQSPQIRNSAPVYQSMLGCCQARANAREGQKRKSRPVGSMSALSPQKRTSLKTAGMTVPCQKAAMHHALAANKSPSIRETLPSNSTGL